MKILDVPQSGSLAGQTSSRNRFGQYRRSRAIPVNPNTNAQQRSRGALSAQSAAWRSLTQPQRDAWDAYASVTPRVDSLGQQTFLSGFQQFVAVNAFIATVNDIFGSAVLALRTDPPSNFSPVVTEIETVSITTSNMVLDLASSLNEEDVAVVDMSLPQSAGRKFNNDFRSIAIIPPELGSPTNLRANYIARFGNVAVGQKLFGRVRVATIEGKVAYTLPFQVIVAS